MLVKICGLTRLEDAWAARQAGADFLGLILAPSPRRLTLSQACDLLNGLRAAGDPGTARPVLVFRDAALSEISTALAVTGVDWVQLHGREDPAYLAALRRAQPGLKFIKAWEVGACEGDARLDAYLAEAAANGIRPDVLLLDHVKAGPPAPTTVVTGATGPTETGPTETGPTETGPTETGATAAGPTTAEFDRCATRAVHAGLPVWLAGGLNPANVAERLRGRVYQGVDVAGGVESSPGQKDPAALRAFIQRAKAAGASLPPTL